MHAATPPPPVAAAARPVVLRGRTSDGAPMSLTLRGGRIVAVRVTVRRYVCDPEGDIGPLAIASAVATRPGPARRFGFVAGPGSQRLRVDGRFAADARLARGSLRLRGTIGTGDPCSSPRVTFRVAA